MAHRLRLHFGARRSHTDPLSERGGGGSHEDYRGPGPSARDSDVHMKAAPGQLPLPPLSPEYGNLQRYSSVFIPYKASAGGSQTSTLQISLQPCVGNGDLEARAGQGDLGGGEGEGEGSPGSSTGDLAPGGVEGSSCGSSITSDGGYCSSSSIFEPEAPERAAGPERGPARCRTSVPLRRCSSLVIFPRSPCSTPPASPVSPAAVAVPSGGRGPYQTSHQFQVSGGDPAQDEDTKGPSASTPTAPRPSKRGGPAPEPGDAGASCPNAAPPYGDPDHSGWRSSVMLRFTSGDSPGRAPEADPDPTCHHVKLFRSTSCLPALRSTEKTPAAAGQGRGHTKEDFLEDHPLHHHHHHGLQRSISLEVPYRHISCRVSNPGWARSQRGAPHVHIHVSHGAEGWGGESSKDGAAGRKGEGALRGPGRRVRGAGGQAGGGFTFLLHG